ALAQVDGAGEVVPGVLALLAHVDEVELLAPVEPGLDLVHGRLADARPCVLNDLEEAGGVLVCHGDASRSGPVGQVGDLPDAAEAQAAPEGVRRAAPAVRRPGQLGGAHPAPAALAAHPGLGAVLRVGARRLGAGVEVGVVPVAAPLPDVAGDVVQP